MADARDSWFDIFRALGQAFVEVLKAELGVLGEQWKRWGTKAAIALGLSLLAAILVLVYLPGLLIFALIDGLHAAGGWPLWGAALAVAVGLALVAGTLVLVGYFLLKSEADPINAYKARMADHLTWWSSKVLEEGATQLEGERDGVES